MIIQAVRNMGRHIPDPITRTVSRQILKTQKHSPTILFGAGVIGMVGTVVLASQATLKLDEIMTDTEKKLQQVKSAGGLGQARYTEKDMHHDIRIIYTQASLKFIKLYGPAFILGVSSVAALTGSHHILSSRNAGLTAAYAALDKGFAQYRERVVTELGEDKDREFRYGSEDVTIVEDTKNGPKKVNIKRVGPHGASIYARFFDEFCKNWEPNQMSNRTFLQCQQSYANDVLRSRGHIFLNEVYDLLGMDRSKEGQIVGWVLNGPTSDGYVSFGLWDKANERVHDFMFGKESRVLLDFNVDGSVLDLI